MKNKGIYQFTYSNGVIQQKVLISHNWWVYSKLLSEQSQKRCLKCITGGNEWFTDRSPLHEAITTGMLKWFDGSYHPCTVLRIEG